MVLEEGLQAETRRHPGALLIRGTWGSGVPVPRQDPWVDIGDLLLRLGPHRHPLLPLAQLAVHHLVPHRRFVEHRVDVEVVHRPPQGRRRLPLDPLGRPLGQQLPLLLHRLLRHAGGVSRHRGVAALGS